MDGNRQLQGCEMVCQAWMAGRDDWHRRWHVVAACSWREDQCGWSGETRAKFSSFNELRKTPGLMPQNGIWSAPNLSRRRQVLSRIQQLCFVCSGYGAILGP